MSVAEKLCNDIVEPVIKRPSPNNHTANTAAISPIPERNNVLAPKDNKQALGTNKNDRLLEGKQLSSSRNKNVLNDDKQSSLLAKSKDPFPKNSKTSSTSHRNKDVVQNNGKQPPTIAKSKDAPPKDGKPRSTSDKSKETLSKDVKRTSTFNRNKIMVPKDSKHLATYGKNSSVTPINTKGNRFTVIEKKKEVNTFGQRESSGARLIVLKRKSVENITKKIFRDISVNTLISGHLQCNTNCVFKEGTREYCNCKWNIYKPHVKGRVKEIQTNRLESLNLGLADKACASGIETASCGTQSIEDSLYNFKSTIFVPTVTTDKQTMVSLVKTDVIRESWSLPEHHYYGGKWKRPTTSKRWALSHYPVRGPDF